VQYAKHGGPYYSNILFTILIFVGPLSYPLYLSGGPLKVRESRLPPSGDRGFAHRETHLIQSRNCGGALKRAGRELAAKLSSLVYSFKPNRTVSSHNSPDKELRCCVFAAFAKFSLNENIFCTRAKTRNRSLFHSIDAFHRVTRIFR